MSSELFMFENSFISDPLSPFTDPHHYDPFEVLREIQERDTLFVQQNNDQTNTLDCIANGLLSSSPPSVELENISINQFRNAEYSALEVKTEECHVNLDFSGCESTFMPLSYDSAHDIAVKYMQRSYSTNCFESKQTFPFRPQLDSVFEPQNFQNQISSSSEDGFFSGHLRRVCSAGDLQKVKTNMQTKNVVSSSPLSADKSLIEEAHFKVVKYTAEERKQKIDRYRAKRTQRNFNKTIKYACRKTLADNRPRVRGRFARNDETGENIPNKASMFHRYEDEEDHLYIHGFYDEDEEDSARRGSFFNSFGSTHYPNYSY